VVRETIVNRLSTRLQEYGMNARKAPICGCLAALVFGSTLTFAQIPDALTGASPVFSKDHSAGQEHWMSHDGTGRFDEFRTKWADELGLTGQQQSDIQIIIADYAPRFRDLARLGRDTAKALLETSPGDPAYVDRTRDASALAASSAAELVTLLAEMRGKLYSVLTPEQRDKLEALRQEHRDAKADSELNQ
jgi:Spy/CpxP family protein refolding chaperone